MCGVLAVEVIEFGSREGRGCAICLMDNSGNQLLVDIKARGEERIVEGWLPIQIDQLWRAIGICRRGGLDGRHGFTCRYI